MITQSTSAFFTFHPKLGLTIRRMASTIFALSSGPPPAAIAVLRISGSQSEMALRNLTRHQKPFKPLFLFYTPIFDQKGRLLDKAMACFMVIGLDNGHQLSIKIGE